MTERNATRTRPDGPGGAAGPATVAGAAFELVVEVVRLAVAVAVGFFAAFVLFDFDGGEDPDC